MRVYSLLLFTALLPGETLAPLKPGAPQALGGDVQLEQRGGSLRLAARLAEPGGRVLARSMGRNPVWEKDAPGSPEVEDRVGWRIGYKSSAGLQRNLFIEFNPWGGYRAEEGGQLTRDLGIVRSAKVTEEGWNVEATLPLNVLDIDWNSPSIQWRAERVRSRRALAPEFRWQWPASTEFATLRLTAESKAQMPSVPAPAEATKDAAIEIGRVLRLPAAIADWEDPAWQGIPAFELSRNEPERRAPKYRTQIKWMHDGRTLAILARMEEPAPVVARAGGRDAPINGDDHIGIYLTTSGSAFLEIIVNPAGAIRDVRGSGPRITQPRASWNASIEAQANIRHRHWIARINIPLDECAAVLGEIGIPKQWRILLARHRAARPEEAEESSALAPADGSGSLLAPRRYHAMVLRDEDPSRVKRPQSYKVETKQGLENDLAALDSRVWPLLYRRTRAVRTMVPNYLHKKAEHAVLAERSAWEKVQTRADWEQFRDQRMQALKQWAGTFPTAKPPLEARVTARRQGEGYRLENIVFQIRPQYWMAANLYLPTQAKQIPGIIIVPSQHYPKTQGELHDMGEMWARSGSAVLIIERPGYGERTETTPYYRQGTGSRFNFSKQLFLVGESYSGWSAWDVIRSVDFLYERPEIDKQRIILLGSVAGGGEIAGMAAALDPRITAVAPYNYDQGHVRIHGDLPGQIAGQFSPWLISASVAPRKFIRAFEFGWEGAEEPDYPNLWVDGMERSQKVWGFYNAAENLATTQAYGLIRLSMERVSHCFSIGPQQRLGLYPIFQRWFQMAFPSKKDLSILPDSDLSTNPDREEARRQEAVRRRPHSDLLSITPEAALQLKRKAMHQLAFESGKEQLDAARARRRTLSAKEQATQLRNELQRVLGDIDPVDAPMVENLWKRSLVGADIQALSLTVEDGISVPVLLLTPAGNKAAPVVVTIAQQGKERFLANRSSEIAKLLAAGIAVCLPDVRATGETASAGERGDGGTYQRMAQTEFDLGRSLLGSRLKDLRTVLAHLKRRTDVDGKRSRCGATPSRHRMMRRSCRTIGNTTVGRTFSGRRNPWERILPCWLRYMMTKCVPWPRMED
ncbi:MAG TPA: acetylxylan esterase [Bryobacteraceae bacterium]|nr:acetylxylan esterase [Bryobacteraceae bacterium]